MAQAGEGVVKSVDSSTHECQWFLSRLLQLDSHHATFISPSSSQIAGPWVRLVEIMFESDSEQR